MAILLHSQEQRQAQRQYVVDVMSQFDTTSRFFADDIRRRGDCEIRIRHDFNEKSNPSRIETYSEWMEMSEKELGLATMRDVHIETFYPRKINRVKPVYQRAPRISVFLTLKFLFPVRRCGCGDWDINDGLYENCWTCHREADERFQASLSEYTRRQAEMVPAMSPEYPNFVQAILTSCFESPRTASDVRIATSSVREANHA
jgi:hypothetical protein